MHVFFIHINLDGQGKIISRWELTSRGACLLKTLNKTHLYNLRKAILNGQTAVFIKLFEGNPMSAKIVAFCTGHPK